MDHEGQNQEISVVYKGPTGNWTRGHVCYILAENLTTFGPCTETLLEIQMKSGGVIDMENEISRQPNIQAA